MTSSPNCHRCNAGNQAAARRCRGCGFSPTPGDVPTAPRGLLPAGMGGALLLGVCLAASLLAACGSQGGSTLASPARTTLAASATATAALAVVATEANTALLDATGDATATSAAGTATALAATDETALSRATATLAPTVTFAPTVTLGPNATEVAQTGVAVQIASAQSLTATALVISPTPAATATLAPATPRPTVAAKRLRFVKLNENDEPSCVSVQIAGIDTSGWLFQVDGAGIVGRFDGNGNARACGLAPRQEVTLTMFDARRSVVSGGGGVPARGSAILQATWR